MLQRATQETRHLSISTPLGPDVLLLESFTGRESFSELFQFTLRLCSTEDQIAPEQILGRNVTFLIEEDGREPRYFNGFVQRFSQVATGDRFAEYRAEVVPWLWFLSQTSDCRIFQFKSTPEIVERIFRDLGFTDFDSSGLSSDYAQHEYCVQYRETDLAFVSRLLEEEGIFYFFRHENGRHVLCLADSNNSYFDVINSQVNLSLQTRRNTDLTNPQAWQHGKQLSSGRNAVSDYNYHRPALSLVSECPSNINALAKFGLQRFEYPGRFMDRSRGTRVAQLLMEEQESMHEWMSGEGPQWMFAPGSRFTVTGESRFTELGDSFVVQSIDYEAGPATGYETGPVESEMTWNTRFTAIPASITFRPRRQTPHPIVEGPQTAMVVGPAGEQIFTDKDGRVKCQFHWDREGSLNENSSCWIRVSQSHAGAGWGTVDLPRIGEEVIVAFLDGDPDRPIIKGRVYNGSAVPPFALPAEMTRSGGKSNTHQGSGFNEVSMDDTAGKEQLRVNAQYNMDTSIGNSQTLKIGLDRAISIGNNQTLTVAVDSATTIGNDATITVGNNEDIVAGNKIVLEAGVAITLQCGLSTIHMNQAGVITISGQFVSSIAKAMNTILAPMTEIAGSSLLTQAGLICLDVSGIKNVKGGETLIEGSSVEIKGGSATVIKGAPIKLGDAGAPVVAIPAPSDSASTTAAANSSVPSSGTASSKSPPLQDDKKGSQPPIEDEQRTDSGELADSESAERDDRSMKDRSDDTERRDERRTTDDGGNDGPDQTNSQPTNPTAEMTPEEMGRAGAEKGRELINKHGGDLYAARGDAIDARHETYDRALAEKIGESRGLNAEQRDGLYSRIHSDQTYRASEVAKLTTDERDSLHNPILTNADRYLEMRIQSDNCGIAAAQLKAGSYDAIKWASGTSDATDNDGRSSSRLGIGQSTADVEAVRDARSHGIGDVPPKPGTCAEQSIKDLQHMPGL